METPTSPVVLGMGGVADIRIVEVIVSFCVCLHPCRYSVRVRCRNSVGWSAWSPKSEEYSTRPSSDRRCLPPIYDAGASSASAGLASDWNHRGMCVG